MKISKDFFFTVIKHLIVAALLLCATLLLLELPALYYKKADSELLLEQGMSTYQLKSVNQNYILFSEKLKIFRDAYGNYALGDFTRFTEEEVRTAEALLAGEITALLGEDYGAVSKALERGEMESRGMCIPMMDYSEEQVKMWDIGVLEFTCDEKNWGGVAVYDGDSGKLFLFSCEVPGVWKEDTEEERQYWEELPITPFEGYAEEDVPQKIQAEDSYMERVKAYYDGVEVDWEESSVYFGEEVFVAPFTMEELDRSSLLWEIQYYFEKMYGSTY